MEFNKEYSCDECEKLKKSLRICLDCIETFCKSCEMSIHNKGTRVMHTRVKAHQTFYQDVSNSKFKITFFSDFCYRNYFHTNQPIEQVERLIFEHILENSKRGKPMLNISEIRKCVSS